MPLTEKNLEIERSIDFGMLIWEDEQDETFLSHISPYSTLRAGDLKHGTGGQSQNHRTLEEILSTWNKDVVPKCLNDESSESQVESDVTENDTALQDYELPVTGFNVDSRIAPGFKYTVRCIGEKHGFFNGEARRLDSVGIGYGRRLTFQGDRLNFNDCYFWSDSSPSGFAFSIQAIKEGDVFTIYNSESLPIGEATIETVDQPQVEQDTVIENGSIVKNVLVRFTNSVRYFSHHCNLVDILNSQELKLVEGVAELVKPKGRKEAFVRCIKNVNLHKVGQCTLQAEP